MSTRLDEFSEGYRLAFFAYLSDRGEATLSAAYELGRAAVTQELSVLDLASAHHEALISGFERDVRAEAATRAAADFFLESLSAFEMAQRALRAARDAALAEKRHATILRRLSSFLADASLALDAAGSLDEMLQLVAEHAREVIGAESCVVLLSSRKTGERNVEAVASDEGGAQQMADARSLAALYASLRPERGSLRMGASDLGPHTAHVALAERGTAARVTPRGWLAASLTALDGSDLGLIQLFEKREGDFSELDEAVLTQLAQMASAAVERTQLYHSNR